MSSNVRDPYQAPQSINSSHTPSSNLHKKSLQHGIRNGQLTLDLNRPSSEVEENESLTTVNKVLPPKEDYRDICFGRNVCKTFSAVNVADWLQPEWFPQWCEQNSAQGSKCGSVAGSGVGRRVFAFGKIWERFGLLWRVWKDFGKVLGKIFIQI